MEVRLLNVRLAGLMLAVLCAGSVWAVEVGEAAPALEGGKWFSANEQAPELKDKVYVVEFWFSACPPCNASVPHLRELAAKYAEKGLVVVAPSPDKEEKVVKFKAKHEISEYALLADAKKTAQAYGVKGYPAAFIVGKDGKVVWKGHPAGKEFEAQLVLALDH